VAHACAATLADAYFALGFAMGQDRLWQLDYLRRRVRGRLAEIMGMSCLASDRLMRTSGIAAAAERAAAAATPEISEVLGSNAAAEQAASNMPLEFEVLDYAFEPWAPADSIAPWKWRWWMLSGRMDLIALQEVCKRHLPPNLLSAFLQVEAGEETIVPGMGSGGARCHDSGLGSNNWVVGPERSSSGLPVLASDPHNALDPPSQWYEAHIQAPGIDAIGAFYLGTPGIYLGRTRGASWGLTNHLASGRDLYIEKIEDSCYREGDSWKSWISTYSKLPCATPQQKSCASCAQSGFEAMLALMRANSQEQILGAQSSGPFPTAGGNGTVRAAGFSTTQPFVMTSGSTHRLVVDMGCKSHALATMTGGSSGHANNPHYADQTALWLTDSYHPLEMDLADDDV
jgi:acyl-homoserine lactone acylase PvdQ